jgi:hypothetical protein
MPPAAAGGRFHSSGRLTAFISPHEPGHLADNKAIDAMTNKFLFKGVSVFDRIHGVT